MFHRKKHSNVPLSAVIKPFERSPSPKSPSPYTHPSPHVTTTQKHPHRSKSDVTAHPKSCTFPRLNVTTHQTPPKQFESSNGVLNDVLKGYSTSPFLDNSNFQLVRRQSLNNIEEEELNFPLFEFSEDTSPSLDDDGAFRIEFVPTRIQGYVMAQKELLSKKHQLNTEIDKLQSEIDSLLNEINLEKLSTNSHSDDTEDLPEI